MSPRRLPSLAAPITLLIALLGAIGHPGDAVAADRATRLTLTVELQRQASSRAGADTGRMQFSQRVDYAITLLGDGVPMINNPLDPEDPAHQWARAQRTQQRVQTALAQAAARSPGRVVPPPLDLQALQAQALQMQARCGNDPACLMREASQLSARQMAARGGPGTAATAGTVPDELPDESPETPYLHFHAGAACSPAGGVHIDERIDGSFADVQGQVAFSDTRQADDRQAVATLPCGAQLLVLDTRNGRLWAGNPLAALQPRGVSVHSEHNRPSQRSEGPVGLSWYEASTWLFERLQNLNRQGSAEATLPAGANGRIDGQARVRIGWRWQEL